MNEQQIGESVRACREAAAMSQADLAAEMRERGPKWSQATVWSLEKGTRPLRHSEAIHLAELIGLPLDPSNPDAAGDQRGRIISAIARLVAEYGTRTEYGN